MQAPPSVIYTDDSGSGATLIEFNSTCSAFSLSSRTCSIFASPDRPKLCSEFPDNLFDRDDSGQLILYNQHAEQMKDLYKSYCPAIASIP
jgi:Fe-S-cluster containining protein